MNLLGIGKIVESVGNITDELFTSKEEKLKIALEEKRMENQLMRGQLEINKAEAQHSSKFVAGWRPFIGWVGGIALAYQFLIYPVLTWFWTLAQAKNWIPAAISPPPVFDSGPLFAIVTGMLGIGSMRSYDKLKGTDTKRVG
ncbi:MAG: holin family protein [Candidatus Marinimicrobia bacterium]|nr:holin family protein [Candidatus Neomarinimicrobiota bacterium]